jgi:hypothetical protein
LQNGMMRGLRAYAQIKATDMRAQLEHAEQLLRGLDQRRPS